MDVQETPYECLMIVWKPEDLLCQCSCLSACSQLVCKASVIMYLFLEWIQWVLFIVKLFYFQKLVFFKNTWFCFFALGGAVSCLGHPFPSPQNVQVLCMCNMQRAISVNICSRLVSHTLLHGSQYWQHWHAASVVMLFCNVFTKLQRMFICPSHKDFPPVFKRMANFYVLG